MTLTLEAGTYLIMGLIEGYIGVKYFQKTTLTITKFTEKHFACLCFDALHPSQQFLSHVRRFSCLKLFKLYTSTN